MMRIIYFVLFALYSCLGYTESFNFQPTLGDMSIQYLGNVFGVVDGVLHGNNQLFGILMGVFNSMVLALGGVVIAYTLIVSTLNTAKDGKMLGEKFNSMWVPLRSVIGLGLLVPKLSGYCALQVLIMWITVQGVGAADRLWEATLSYLNRGGRIVAAITEDANKTSKGAYQQIKLATIATNMLAGQVCMLGIQRVLQDEQAKLQKQKNSDLGGGKCDQPLSKQPPLCYAAIPNFIDSVNAIDYQSSHGPDSGSPQFNMPMPNFSDGNPYAILNGICGNVFWDSLEKSYPKLNVSSMKTIKLNESEQQAVILSRAVAIQQVYTDLSSLAYSMIENAAAAQQDPTKSFSIVAKNQFGVPWNSSSNSICSSFAGCNSWQGINSAGKFSSSPILTGTELQLAMNDYNTIISPSLNLASQMGNADKMKQVRSFIDKARSKGWVMAGSYFYNIVRLGGSTAGSQLGENAGNIFDVNIYTGGKTGLNFISNGANLIYDNSGRCQAGSYSALCNWLGDDGVKPLKLLSGLISGDQLKQADMPSWSEAISNYSKGSAGGQGAPVNSIGSSTVLGFVNNGFMVTLPGQTYERPKFVLVFASGTYNTSKYKQPKDVECHRMRLVWFCLGKVLGKVFWALFGQIIDWITKMITLLVKEVLEGLLTYPLLKTYEQLNESVKMIMQPNINPMVGIALTGNHMINLSIELFLNQISILITKLLGFFGAGLIIIGIIGIVVFPVNYALMAVFGMLGATAAYYIPLVPYMIFTFGAMGWIIAVVEAMVAAPLVALGMAHPDGHDTFGKSEQAISIILNVFLRPGLMVIGYMAGNILSYVFAWMVAAGYGQAINFMVGTDKSSGVSTIYSQYGQMFASFMVIITYMSMYTAAIQKAFSLIYHLPDKVIRWIGGHPESYGEEAMRTVEQLREPTQKSFDSLSSSLGKGLTEAKDQAAERAKKKLKNPEA